ncbi:hypothetical protein BDR04DRAFT_737492 [Suillus decipiens]|nr:hypothetical protein BDR04DRAFT_737492 [Suillus decipiens]
MSMPLLSMLMSMHSSWSRYCKIRYLDLKHAKFHGRYGLIYQGKLNSCLVAMKKVLDGSCSPEQFHTACLIIAINSEELVNDLRVRPAFGAFNFHQPRTMFILATLQLTDRKTIHTVTK